MGMHGWRRALSSSWRLDGAVFAFALPTVGVAGLSAPPASVFVAVGNRRPRWVRAYVSGCDVTIRTQVPNARYEFASEGAPLPCT